MSLLACYAVWQPSVLKQVPPTTCRYLSNKLSAVTGHKANISTIHDCKDLYCSFLLHTTYLYLHLMHSGMENSKVELGHHKENTPSHLFANFATCYKKKKSEYINHCLHEKSSQHYPVSVSNADRKWDVRLQTNDSSQPQSSLISNSPSPATGRKSTVIAILVCWIMYGLRVKLM